MTVATSATLVAAEQRDQELALLAKAVGRPARVHILLLALAQAAVSLHLKEVDASGCN